MLYAPSNRKQLHSFCKISFISIHREFIDLLSWVTSINFAYIHRIQRRFISLTGQGRWRHSLIFVTLHFSSKSIFFLFCFINLHIYHFILSIAGYYLWWLRRGSNSATAFDWKYRLSTMPVYQNRKKRNHFRTFTDRDQLWTGS